MKPLEIHCRGRVMFAQISIQDKGLGMRDYYVYHKNKVTFYVFRKSQGDWELAYGHLADDIKEAVIDALILRYDHDVPEMFYHQGKRYVVRVSPKPDGLWHFFVNHDYTSSVKYDKFSKKFEYHLREDGMLTDDHMKKYIAMIERGEIKWIKERP